MKFNTQALTRTFGRQMLTMKKNSPHILFVGGIAGVIGSTVLACRATLKLEETVDEINMDLGKVRQFAKQREDGLVPSEESQAQHYKDLGAVYTRSAIRMGRLYGPSVAVGAVSIAALTGSHIQMTRRNTALTITLAAVTKSLEDYRARVRDILGEERELDVYRAIREESHEIDGKKQIVKIADPNKLSPYARIFDECSSEWTKDPELNRIYIQCQQNYANHKLHARGHVFLNEVYEALGFEHTSAGAVVGWVLNGETSDNYIDFGIFEAYNGRFVNGIERSIILDFNVDGVIYDKI